MLADLVEDIEDLNREFAGGRDDHCAEAGVGANALRAVKVFENGYDEGEGLSAARLSGAEYV